MKKSIVISAIIGLSLTACKKEISTIYENSTLNKNSLNIDETQSYIYIATNSERAKISFENTSTNNTIIMKSNNTKFVLDRKNGDEKSQIYERNGVEAKLTKDSLFIIQDDQVIPLVLSK